VRGWVVYVVFDVDVEFEGVVLSVGGGDGDGLFVSGAFVHVDAVVFGGVPVYCESRVARGGFAFDDEGYVVVVYGAVRVVGVFARNAVASRGAPCGGGVDAVSCGADFFGAGTGYGEFVVHGVLCALVARAVVDAESFGAEASCGCVRISYKVVSARAYCGAVSFGAVCALVARAWAVVGVDAVDWVVLVSLVAVAFVGVFFECVVVDVVFAYTVCAWVGVAFAFAVPLGVCKVPCIAYAFVID
tara:strand:- start:4604 stop:5335 length:732 start_codon:yes stop_codon:yes gene_type:complete